MQVLFISKIFSWHNSCGGGYDEPLNLNRRCKMDKKIDPKDNQSNMSNANKGTDGTNKQYDQAQGNRGKQLNPNQKDKADKQ